MYVASLERQVLWVLLNVSVTYRKHYKKICDAIKCYKEKPVVVASWFGLVDFVVPGEELLDSYPCDICENVEAPRRISYNIAYSGI
jgi:hypothetical protein